MIVLAAMVQDAVLLAIAGIGTVGTLRLFTAASDADGTAGQRWAVALGGAVAGLASAGIALTAVANLAGMIT